MSQVVELIPHFGSSDSGMVWCNEEFQELSGAYWNFTSRIITIARDMMKVWWRQPWIRLICMWWGVLMIYLFEL